MAELLISPDQIYREVQKAVADALQISAEKVQPDMSLISDLAAESLDFIDINFRLEQRFGVAMPRKYLLDHVEELFGEAVPGLAGDDAIVNAGDYIAPRTVHVLLANHKHAPHAAK